MEFKRYPSLTNHYMDNEIRKFIEINPLFDDEQYIATEKIHDSNISFRFSPDGTIMFG